MKTQVNRLYLYTCAAIASGALAATGSIEAEAQEQPAASSKMLEEVTVYARRREENLMDTPISISAFTQDQLVARQIDQIDQLAQATPGLVFKRQAGNNNHTSRIFIRGIGQQDQVPTKQVGVGLYVDGVYVAQNAGSLIDVVDVESVEILRGPQGTLFGRNTIGGAIQINTIKPHDEFAGEVELLVGSEDRLRLKGMVNVPFTDNFFGRFSGVYQEEDGYVDTPLSTSEGKGGDNVDALRAAFRWQATDAFTADFSIDYSEQSSNGPPSVLGSEVSNLAVPAATPSGYRSNTAAQYNGGFDPTFLAPLFPGGPIGPAYLGQGSASLLGLPPYDNSYYLGPNTTTSLTGQENENNTEVWGANLTLQWDITDNMSLKSITSYRDFDIVAFGDFDQSPLKVFHGFDNHEGEAFSQEIQLSGTAFDDKMAWVGGIYYYDENIVNTNFVDFPQFAIVSGADVDNQSQAIFGQFTYAITDKLDLTLGGRYTEEDYDFALNDELGYISSAVCAPHLSPVYPAFAAACGAAGLNTTPASFPPFPIGPPPSGPNGIVDIAPGQILIPPEGERDTRNTAEEEFDPYVSLSYDLTDELMIYGSYSEGFKGGGFTQRINVGQTIQSFKPEFAELWEVGAKWQSDNVRVTGAIFYNDYTDLQLLTLEDSGGVTRNAGEAAIQGGELELIWAITENLGFSFGTAYLDSEYDDLGEGLEEGVELPIAEDALLPFTAEWQHNASVSYAFGLFSGEFVARLDWSYIDNYYAEAQNLPEQEYGDYSLWNAGLTYTPESDKWQLALGVTNLADEEYRISGTGVILGNGWTQQIVGPPRQWSLRYAYRF